MNVTQEPLAWVVAGALVAGAVAAGKESAGEAAGAVMVAVALGDTKAPGDAEAPGEVLVAVGGPA